MIPYWLRYDHLRYLAVYIIPGYVERAIWGYARHDVWGTDHYLARLISMMLRDLAKRPNGTPMFIIEREGLDPYAPNDTDHTVKLWAAWLNDKAEWFEWYAADDIVFGLDMTDQEKLVVLDNYDKKYTHFKQQVFPDFVKHFDSLWD